MGIVMRFEEGANRGTFLPIVVCDFCGGQITEATNGNARWIMSCERADRRLFFTHKQCNHAFEMTQKPRGGQWGWCPLEVLSVQLSNNLKVKTQHLREDVG